MEQLAKQVNRGVRGGAESSGHGCYATSLAREHAPGGTRSAAGLVGRDPGQVRGTNRDWLT
ncbi:MAG: hypothetical protein J2P37_36255 [Ktedonobacteraceae bacterium]|nr:hypothetical protein [Ktedonobacteraceae bacterium]